MREKKERKIDTTRLPSTMQRWRLLSFSFFSSFDFDQAHFLNTPSIHSSIDGKLSKSLLVDDHRV